MPIRLVDRSPEVSPGALIAGLVPPPLFRDARLETYRPDPDEPTQQLARSAVQSFAATVAAGATRRGRGRRRADTVLPGIYPDGGYGVGKTHLLASLWHAVPGPKAYAGLPSAPAPLPEEEVRALANADGASLDEFDALTAHLATLHPSRYGALVDGVARVYLTGVRAAPDQNVALRLVVLADRLYDRQIPLVVSGAAPDRLFDGDMLAGGYRKKYRRAISRLVALNRLGVGVG